MSECSVEEIREAYSVLEMEKAERKKERDKEPGEVNHFQVQLFLFILSPLFLGQLLKLFFYDFLYPPYECDDRPLF